MLVKRGSVTIAISSEEAAILMELLQSHLTRMAIFPLSSYGRPRYALTLVGESPLLLSRLVLTDEETWALKRLTAQGLKKVCILGASP